jgi:hypothetical protein
MNSASGQAPPGWYPDPETPGSERRWDGSTWVGTPHKSPTHPSLLGPNIDRAYWSNANRPVQIARWVGLGGLVPLVVSFIAVLAMGGFTARSLV